MAVDDDMGVVYVTGTFLPEGTNNMRMLTMCLDKWDPSDVVWYDEFIPSEHGDYSQAFGRSLAIRRDDNTTYVYAAGDAYESSYSAIPFVCRYLAGEVLDSAEPTGTQSDTSWRAMGGERLKIVLDQPAHRDLVFNLYDVQGRLIRTGRIDAGTQGHYVSPLLSGSYFVRIPELGRGASKAIIVN